MQAATVKRFPVNRMQRLGIAVVAIGTLAIGLVGADTLRETQVGTDGSVSSVRAAVAPAAVQRQRFMEWNTQFPLSAAPAQTFADITFLEQNTLLPSEVAATTPNWRFMEENRWGEDFVFADGLLAPSPDGLPQTRAGEVAY